jgi:hypothetical protein
MALKLAGRGVEERTLPAEDAVLGQLERVTLAVRAGRGRSPATAVARAADLLIADLDHVCLCKARMKLARVEEAARTVVAERRLVRDLKGDLCAAERQHLAGRDEVVDVDLVGRRRPGS